MKRLFIFAMMTLAASSSFAIGKKLKCTNGRVFAETYTHIKESQLRLLVTYTVDGGATFRALVTPSGTFLSNPRTFEGRTSDGRQVQLLVENEDGLEGTLKIEGLQVERGLSCTEQTPFNNI